MLKTLGARRNASAICARLIAADRVVSAFSAAVMIARAADDGPYARPEAWLCRPGASGPIDFVATLRKPSP
jgi:hypothetical protein